MHPLEFEHRLQCLDLEPINHYLMFSNSGPRWAQHEVEIAEAAYRQFHLKIKQCPNISITPSAYIDIYWHAHILHTRKYAADCFYLHGRFIHHDLESLGEANIPAEFTSRPVQEQPSSTYPKSRLRIEPAMCAVNT